MTLIVSIIGGSGAGKTTLLNRLQKKGWITTSIGECRELQPSISNITSDWEDRAWDLLLQWLQTSDLECIAFTSTGLNPKYRELKEKVGKTNTFIEVLLDYNPKYSTKRARKDIGIVGNQIFKELYEIDDEDFDEWAYGTVQSCKFLDHDIRINTTYSPPYLTYLTFMRRLRFLLKSRGLL